MQKSSLGRVGLLAVLVGVAGCNDDVNVVEAADTSTSTGGGDELGDTDSGESGSEDGETEEDTGEDDDVGDTGPGTCGDGVVDEGEACDDGNDDNTDACLNSCELASCGDGFVGPGEGCDDGNDVDDDGCTNACKLPSCGDGILQDGEGCDDGNGDDTDACLSTCVAASCGDGFVWLGEEPCDDGNGDDTDACLSTCEQASCGDGIVWAGVEECDDGNPSNVDACTNECLSASCGDGFLQPGEGCDDGDLEDNDECPSTCVAASCGDGFVWAGVEQCDDGNLDDDDGCLSTCEPATCGDGFVWAGVEQCDDQNADANDGCANDCGYSIITAASVGGNHGCVSFGGQRVRCWGRNDQGQLGHGDEENKGDEPGEMPPPWTPKTSEGVVQLANGGLHSCAIVGDGVRCWGDGIQGQLGHSGSWDLGDAPGELPAPLVPLGLFTVATQMSAGNRHNCARLTSQNVHCWGSGFWGALGYGNTENIGDEWGEMPPPAVSIGGPVAQVDAGLRHTCALLQGGSVRCWGDNTTAQLGRGDTESIGDEPGEMPPAPVDVGPGTVVKVSAGSFTTCALMASGALRCWGSGQYGQLGRGSMETIGDEPGEMPPPDVPLTHPVVDVEVGDLEVCALYDTQEVTCWGYGGWGTLGKGDTENIGDEPGEMPPSPIDVGGPVEQLVHGSSAATFKCVVLSDRTLRCWGRGDHGGLGNAMPMEFIGDDPGEMPPPPMDLY